MIGTVALMTALSALSCAVAGADNSYKQPTVMVAMLIRNKEAFLPYTLSRLVELDYPKDRMSLWLRSDFNEDRSIDVVKAWLAEYGHEYNDVDAVFNATTPALRPDETNPLDLSPGRYRAVTAMKELALESARGKWADYVWFLDADAVLHENDVLKRLVALNKPILAPMLRSDLSYSNFWSAMSDDYYYARGEDYAAILKRKKVGCFAVPLINSCVLVDLRLRWSDRLTFTRANMLTPTGPEDDVITFALSARQAGLEMFICNQDDFGQITVPLQPPEVLSKERLNIVNVKLEAMIDHAPLPVVDVLKPFLEVPPEPSTHGFDRVYMIGLARRPDRRSRMLAAFSELGIDAQVVDAVDGRKLNETYLLERGVAMLDIYLDPINSRKLTYGEIGCFLSHYGVWEDVVKRKLDKVMVLEDDVRFASYFEWRVERLLEEIKKLKLDWDLVYLGRKILQRDEAWVDGARTLVHPEYTYWTLGYALTGRGAQKLIDGKPLGKMMAVDEYIPMMFNKHPNQAWAKHYPERNLKAFSASPLLMHPIKYTGEPGYVSDTEDAPVVDDGSVSAPAAETASSGSGLKQAETAAADGSCAKDLPDCQQPQR